MKIIKLLLILLLLLTGCSARLGATDTGVAVEKEILDIEKQQEKEKDGKYKYKPKYEKDGVFYEVNEYQTPDGKVGYQIHIETEEYTMSTGTGPLAKERSFYKVKPEPFISATSTK